ncbi:MAG: glycosyltransferase family 1 protein, partial [Cyanobacteria bacterium P01_H01_bin.15]
VPEVMGDAGILLDPDDLKGFAQQMEQIYRDDSFRQALCDRSRARASQFSWQRTGQATAQVLERFV